MKNSIAIKRLIYIISGVILLGIFGYVLYRSAITPEQKQPEEIGITGRFPGVTPPFIKETPGQQILEPEISGALEARLIRLTDFPVISAALNKNEDKIFFYKKEGGDLFSSDFKGENKEKVSNLTIIGISEAMWSPLKDRAAVFYLDQETKKGFLHLGTSSVAVLPQDIHSFSWSPDGKSLAYLIKRNSEADLIIADSSGKNPKTVFRTPLVETNLQWITTDKIAFETAPSGLTEGFLFLYSRGSGTLNKIISGFGITSLWSPDGKKIITASTKAEGKNLNTVLYDSSGQEIWTPALTTLPEKCAWFSAKELICAVPRSISPRAIWPDGYLRGEIFTSDRVVILDSDKKTIQEIFNEGNFDITNLLITKDQSYLVFADRRDGTLWSLKLR